jgi:alkylated DNA repair dioxygenase AlkB
MVEILGNLGPTLARWHTWAARQPVTTLLQSRYARGRLETYYGLGVTLGQTPTLYPARQDPQVNALGQQWLKGWHSALLCKYNPGVGINPHRDHTCFQRWAVMVNLGEANFFEYIGKDKQVTPLPDGAIVRLNTKVLHGILPVSQTRYSLTFRHIKPGLLPTEQQLSLLSGLAQKP